MTALSAAPVTRILRQPVRNLQGLPLGEIEELVIDPARGFIAYVVLAHGDPADLVRKRFAIPWGAISVDARGQLRLDLEPEVLEHAPGLADADMPCTLAGSGMACTSSRSGLH